MSNKKKAKEILECSKCTFLKNIINCSRCYDKKAVLKMANWKDKCSKNVCGHLKLNFKNQEQSLLWTLYSILDGLAVEGEAREYAINEFKKHLEYYKED